VICSSVVCTNVRLLDCYLEQCLDLTSSILPALPFGRILERFSPTHYKGFGGFNLLVTAERIPVEVHRSQRKIYHDEQKNVC